MTILVECECGEKFAIDTDDKRHKSNNDSSSVFVGSMKCPNPNCELTIYIDAIIMADVDDCGRNDLVNWDEIKENDSLYHGGLPFEVAYKTVRNKGSKKILALRSLSYGENVIAEVDDIGNLFFVPWIPHKHLPITDNPPRTDSGFESWTDEQFNSLKENISEVDNWNNVKENGSVRCIGSLYRIVAVRINVLGFSKLIYLRPFSNGGENIIVGISKDDEIELMKWDLNEMSPFSLI